ncbi:MAG: hypothetical protein EU530_09045 [Promethearchaeota archaeon]|nr:MAG: hypothetical protein EU530_09045 [Candidatus Lokiarchaeota archaeon]
MSERFNERFSTLGYFFLLYGILSFFGFNNYAPYSIFYIRFEVFFFIPSFSYWIILVMVTHGLFLTFILRMRMISNEMDDEGFSKFSKFLLIGGSLVITAVVIEFGFSLFPLASLDNFKMTAWIGIVYSVVLSIGCLLQIIAYLQVYAYGEKGETEIAKIMKKRFGKAPLFIVIGNVIAIISYVLSIVGGVFIIREPFQNPFPPIFNTFDFALWAPFLQIGWVIINSIAYIIIGSNIINTSSFDKKKSYTIAKQEKVKKISQSCPVCRNSIYEGQKTCRNCGYRII